MDETASESVKQLWSLGDYSRLAARLAVAAGTIADTVGDGDGRPALDVAAGTGSLALALARRGWSVTATDITPALVARGRDRSAQGGFDIAWHEASLDQLPFLDRGFDLVGSSFGLIFAPDPATALAEAHRLLRPGGMLAFSAWTPSSYMAAMTRVMATFLPPGPQFDGPFRWGSPDTTTGWLESAGFTDPTTTTHTLPWTFPSADDAAAFMFAHSPAHVAAVTAAGEQGHAMRGAVRHHLAGLAEPDGSIDIAAEYVITTAHR